MSRIYEGRRTQVGVNLVTVRTVRGLHLTPAESLPLPRVGPAELAASDALGWGDHGHDAQLLALALLADHFQHQGLPEWDARRAVDLHQEFMRIAIAPLTADQWRMDSLGVQAAVNLIERERAAEERAMSAPTLAEQIDGCEYVADCIVGLRPEIMTAAAATLRRLQSPDKATVERVARAIYAGSLTGAWEELGPHLRERRLNKARAAIRAMGEAG